MTIDNTGRKQLIRFILGALTALGFFGMLALLVFRQIPEANREVFTTLLGFLGGAFTTMMAFYYGDSEGSGEP